MLIGRNTWRWLLPDARDLGEGVGEAVGDDGEEAAVFEALEAEGVGESRLGEPRPRGRVSATLS